MSYIKKTNMVETRQLYEDIKRIRCPYCHTFLEHIPKYVTAMLCWNYKKEFRVEQDSDKWESSNIITGIHTMKRY